MKTRLLFLTLFMIVAMVATGQDVQSVKAQLEQKYDKYRVNYQTDNGGWFKVANSKYIYNADRTEIVKVELSYGACDKNGRELIPPAWKEIKRVGDVFVVTNKNGWFGIRGMHNEEILPCQYSEISDFEYSQGKNPYFSIWKNRKEGAFDIKRQRVVIPAVYDMVTYFTQLQVFKVQRDGFHGILDKDGRELLPCNRYNTIDLGYMKKMGGYCMVKKGNQCGVIDSLYHEVVPCVYEDMNPYHLDKLKDHQICDIQRNELCGVYHIGQQKEIVPCVYTDLIADEIANGETFRVRRPGGGKGKPEKMGLFDSKTMKEILPCGKYSYIKKYDKEKQTVQVCKGMDFTDDEESNKLIVHKQGKWGIYDLKRQKEIIPCKYDLIKTEEDGLYPFCKGCTITLDGYADYVVIEGGKWGYIDAMCNEIVAPQYDWVEPFKDGVAQVKKDGVTSLLQHPLQGTSLKLANGGDGSPVDKDIPATNKKNENLFAFIIANENYANFKGADFSINDGKVFAEYCKKTLGVPERNVRYYEDATYGNMVGAVKKLQDIADAYDGDAQIIFYYSGLGATDDKTTERYLLATDASMTALSKTGYEVKALLNILNAQNVQNIWVVIDAPFSNLDKTGQPLATSRGVAIKPKNVITEGKAIVTLSSEGSQTAYSSKEFSHSLFTYALLEKMQKSKGNCTIKEMTDYAATWVKRNAMSGFDNLQTPQVVVSDKMANQWSDIKF
jgi:hypothetical protein